MHGHLQMRIDDWHRNRAEFSEGERETLIDDLLELVDAQEIELQGWRQSAVVDEDGVSLRPSSFTRQLIATHHGEGTAFPPREGKP